MRAKLLAPAAAMLALLVGCEEDAPPAGRRGPGLSPVAAPGSAPAPAPRGAPVVVRPDRDQAAAREAVRTPHAWGAGPIEVAAPAATATAAPAPARDYAREVQAAIGAPTSCVDLAIARASGGTLHIPVTVTVTALGRVTRASVGGSLPEPARACVERLAAGITLAGPIERAPRTISTELTIGVSVTEPPPATPPPSRPRPGVQPSLTLPAVGAEGRPAGAVAPDRTLPAVGAEGRPAGSVAPDVVLPATGGSGIVAGSGSR